MASALEQLTSKSTENPASFYDFYNAYMDDKYAPHDYRDVDPNNVFVRIANWFDGSTTSAKQQYEQYLQDFEFKRNQAAKEAENKWTAEREDSQVQRALKDIKDAGLNPWLALNGGSMSSAIVSSQSASARYKVKNDVLKNDKSGKGSSLLGSALKIIMMAALMS